MNILVSLHGFADWGLLALRLAVGATFLAHGSMKKGMWKMQPSAQMGAGMLSLMRLLSVAEPLGGAAVILGLLTQPAAAGLGLVMVGAIKLKVLKWKAPFASNDKMGWEFDSIILGACLVLLTLGAGALSLDRTLLGL